MKKTLLTLSAFIIAGATMAQVCVPNPDYADETFGIWPDIDQGFSDGSVGNPYLQVIDFKIPEDPSEVPVADGTEIPEGSTVDSVMVVGVDGLPDGLDFGCQSHTDAPCTFLPDVQGCAVLTGIPTSGGEYPLTINTVIYLSLFNGSLQIPFPFSYEDYSIFVDGPSSVAEMAEFGLKLGQNMPNPFEDETVIEFTLNQPVLVDFNVYNLLGKSVYAQGVNASQGVNRIELNAGDLGMTSGIYLYSLTIEGQTVTRKMVLK
jgi:hypothetical protein